MTTYCDISLYCPCCGHEGVYPVEFSDDGWSDVADNPTCPECGIPMDPDVDGVWDYRDQDTREHESSLDGPEVLRAGGAI